ncbi:MAG: alpha/beta hydrolase [Polyangiaceae bacterium]
MRLETGLTLHVLEWGPEQAPPLLCLHGFLDNAWTWAPLTDAGLQDFRVIAPDLRGHGDSDRVGGGGYYHFFDYLPDVAGLVDALALDRVAVVGHSMGGTVASYFAGAFPERVTALALLEGIGPPQDDADPVARVRGWVEAWRRRVGQQPSALPNLDAAAKRLQAADGLLSVELAQRLARLGTHELPDGRRRFKHDPLHLTRGPYPFRAEVAEAFWRQVQCPVMYVEGEQSSYRALGSEIDRRLACFGRVERHTLPNAGHMLQRHRPELLAELLDRFLRT